MRKKVNVGIIGLGTIGSGVANLLLKRRKALREKTGVDLNILLLCDKDSRAKKAIKVPREIFTKDASKIIRHPDIDIIVELIGGVHPAKEITEASLKAGKDVVTANKLLLASEGCGLFRLAKRLNREIYFEASVAGGIPIIKSISEGMVANSFSTIFGILNGTSNYILSKMSDEGVSFRAALKEAQSRGYAERDPSLDIKGLDTAHKLGLLTLLAFGKEVCMEEIFVEGIEEISSQDISYARELGYVVKLLAIAKRVGSELELRVHPTLLPADYLLSSVSGVYNAIFVVGDLVGRQLYYGEGAGKFPAASSVISDIIDAALKHKVRTYKGGEVRRIKNIRDVETRYYVRFSAIDKPGVLAKISDLLGQNNISIASVVQKEKRDQRVVPIIMLTHEARECDMQNALKKIDRLSAIKRESVLIRLER